MEIDLGRRGPSPCGPATPVDEPLCYPSLYIDGDSDELSELPESGTLTVKFRRRSKTDRTTKEGVVTSLELEILKITDASGPRVSKRKRSREDEIDRLAEESKDINEDED